MNPCTGNSFILNLSRVRMFMSERERERKLCVCMCIRGSACACLYVHVRVCLNTVEVYGYHALDFNTHSNPPHSLPHPHTRLQHPVTPSSILIMDVQATPLLIHLLNYSHIYIFTHSDIHYTLATLSFIESPSHHSYFSATC